jgi:RPA family protein
MEVCKSCGKKLIHVEGRKEKSFCNVNCRNKWFYKKNRELINKARAISIQPNETKKQKAVLETPNIPLFKNDIEKQLWEIQQQQNK